MAISEAPHAVRHLRDQWSAFAPTVLDEPATQPPQLFLLASASEDQVDRQAVQSARRHAQHHRNMIGAACLGAMGSVFSLALLMVQLAK